MSATGTLAGVHRFVEAVRREGVEVPTGRIEVLLAALTELGPEQVYWAGRLTLCSGRADLAAYDRAYRSLLGEAPQKPYAPPIRTNRPVIPFGVDGAAKANGGPEDSSDLTMA